MEILYKPQTTFSLTFEVIHQEAVINVFQDLIRFAVFFTESLFSVWFFLFIYSWNARKISISITNRNDRTFHLTKCCFSLELARRVRQVDAGPFLPKSIFQNSHFSGNSHSARSRPETGFVRKFRIRSPFRHRLSTLEHRPRNELRSSRCRTTEKNVSVGRPRKCAQTLWLGSARCWTRWPMKPKSNS